MAGKRVDLRKVCWKLLSREVLQSGFGFYEVRKKKPSSPKNYPNTLTLCAKIVTEAIIHLREGAKAKFLNRKLFRIKILPHELL